MESRDWSSDVCSSDLFPSHDNCRHRGEHKDDPATLDRRNLHLFILAKQFDHGGSHHSSPLLHGYRGGLVVYFQRCYQFKKFECHHSFLHSLQSQLVHHWCSHNPCRFKSAPLPQTFKSQKKTEGVQSPHFDKQLGILHSCFVRRISRIPIHAGQMHHRGLS